MVVEAEVVAEVEAAVVVSVAVASAVVEEVEVVVIEVEEEAEVDLSHQSQKWLSAKVTLKCCDLVAGEYFVKTFCDLTHIFLVGSFILSRLSLVCFPYNTKGRE